tara:strand:+ start:216 stop:446 length:231 start_codon:yes stop_codon:yes gene_type:complete
MQKLFNAMSLSAFLMSGALIAGSVMLYTRIPSLTKYYMSELTLEMTKIMTRMLPSQIDEAMPKLPTETGLPIKPPF